MKKKTYNAEKKIKIFFSDQIGEKVVSIRYRNDEIFCTIKDKITLKRKEILLSVALIFVLLLGRPKQAREMGVPTTLNSHPEIHRLAPQHFNKYKYTPTVRLREDKIRMMANNNNNMIPLIYINGHYSYINEQLLKKL